MSTEKLELTEREIALARGDDPDAAGSAGVYDDSTAQEEPQGAEVIADAEGESHTDDQEGVGSPVESSGQEEEATDGAQRGTDAPSSWIDDEARALGQSYGLTEEDLQAFSTPDEFRKAARFFDRQLVKPVSSTDTLTEKGREQSKSGQNPDQSGQAENLPLDPEAYKEAGYDDDTVNLVRFVRDQQEKKDAELKQIREQLEQVHKFYQQQEERRQIEEFHVTVDALDESRYGRTFDATGRVTALSKAHDDNRRKLFEAASTLEAGLTSRGQAVPPLPVLLKRAEHLAFAEEISQQEKKRVQEAAAQQSRRRRPVAGGRPNRPPTTRPAQPDDPLKEVVDHPDIVKLWSQFQEANGA